MDFRNCPQCGKLFKKINRNLCQTCIDEEEKMYETVRQYVRDNPNAGVVETSEATGVSERLIMRFLREGRLLTSNVSLSLECQSCGKPISAGTYCSKCVDKLSQGFGLTKEKAVHKEQDDESQKMYIADRLNKKNRD